MKAGSFRIERIFKWTVLLSAGSMLLAGCGLQTQSETEKNEKVVLSVLAGQSTSDAGIEDMISEAVAQKYPQAELEWECVDWGENFDDSMRARLSSGDIPDIIIGKSQDVAAYARSGILAEIRVDHMDQVKTEALETVKVDGKIFGIPYNAWYQGVIYNKEIFRQYGLKVPRTKTELEQAVQILEAGGETAFAGHFQENWKVGNLFMQMLINEIFLDNPRWGEDFREKKTSFSSDDSLRGCLMDVKYIYDHSFSNASVLEQAESDRLFEEGEAAMYPGGCWSLQFVNQSGKDVDYGIFPYPNENGDSRLIRETNLTFMKSAFTREEELVDGIFQLLMEDTRLMAEILEFTESFSVRKDVQAGGHICISEDIEEYEQKGRVIEAAAGNSQLVWRFQNMIAWEILEWLKGKQSLEQVLAYGDESREESSGFSKTNNSLFQLYPTN